MSGELTESAGRDHPFITVAIVAHNSGAIIRGCIDTVLSQDYPRDRFSVLVVDDSNDTETAALCREKGLEYIYAPETNSPGKARNVALEHAKGEIVAFIDTDCLAPPDWLTRIVKDFEENPQVAGVVGAYSGGKSWIQKIVNKEHVRGVKVKGLSTGFLEGNCAFRTSELDGKRFGIHKYGEGIVLAEQLSQEGHELLTDYDLRVVHLGFTHSLKKFFRMGRAHYHNTKSYFKDTKRSGATSATVVASAVLLVFAAILRSPFLAIPAVVISTAFIFYAHRWHSPLPFTESVPSYVYFVVARWLFWMGYFRELVKPDSEI